MGEKPIPFYKRDCLVEIAATTSNYRVGAKPTTFTGDNMNQFTYTFSITVAADTAEDGFNLVQDQVEEDISVLFENIVDYEQTGTVTCPSKIRMVTRIIGEA